LDSVLAACDPETLRRIAEQAVRTDEDLLQLAVYPGQVSNSRLVRATMGKGGSATQQAVTAILEKVADGRAQVHFNPNNPNQVWVRIEGETDFHVFHRSSEAKSAGGQRFDDVTYSYGGSKNDVPPGMKELYPELITGAENARELAQAQKLAKKAAELKLPTAPSGGTTNEFARMSGGKLGDYVEGNRSVPFVPDPKKHDLVTGLCEGKVCIKDASGNTWVRGKSRTQGDDFEWDVIVGSESNWLAMAAKKGGFLKPGRNGTFYVNVSLSGRISH